MRILIANANTTEAITEACVAAARGAAAAGTEVVGGTPAFGPRVISTRAENAIAAHAMLEMLAAQAGQVDAVVLAVRHDTALDAARQLMPCPVIGMTEAACLTACLLGAKFAILTLGQPGAYQELVERHGLASRCAEVRTIPGTPQDVLRDPALAKQRLVEATEALSARADSVILAGAVLAGMDRELQPKVKVPLLDGIACAVKLAEAVVALGLPKPTTGPFAAPLNRESIGLAAPLAALLRGG